MTDPADTEGMTTFQTIKSTLGFGPDSSFDTVPDGHRTTADEMAARGYDTLDWLTPFIEGVEPVPAGMTELIERTIVTDALTVAQYPSLLLTIAADLVDVTPESIPAERPAGRHYARS